MLRLARDLSSLALAPLAATVCEAAGISGAEHAAAGVVSLLTRHFSDHSQRLSRALEMACQRAWKALEVALAGDTFWERCRVGLASGDERAFRAQLRAFLDDIPAGSLPVDTGVFRQRCLQELRAARKAGLLTGAAGSAEEMAEGAGSFARFQDPNRLVQAQRGVLEGMADELRRGGYKHLAQLLTPPGGPPLLLIAAQYFLRRAVEDDPKLASGLSFARMERLQESQTQGFVALGRLLNEQGEQLEQLLSEVQEVVEQTHAAVLDIHEELRAQGQQNRELYEVVLQLQRRLDMMHAEVRPRDSMSIRNETDRRRVRAVVERYRKLPPQQRQNSPALLNAIGQLEVASGDFKAAEKDFAAVAKLVEEPQAQAAAHANACRAALESRDWDRAFAELTQAIKVGGAGYSPIPLSKYQPLRILGAGGFGVAFLCQHRHLDMRLVVKTLLDEALECGVDQLFAEAQVLAQLNLPGIVRLVDYGYADPENRAHPYLAMDDFDGVNLESHLQEHGPLDLPQWLTVARQTAKALQAAHERGILHRDVKPGNLLVRSEREGLRALLIDFGLALRQDSMKAATRSGKTLFASSIAGTIDYAAPEQMGKLPGVKVGPYSDVYGFGKTCCFALFGTAQPVLKHWQSVPEPIADLLSRCMGEQPNERPQSFAVVLRCLDTIGRQLRIGVVQPMDLVREMEIEQKQAAPAPSRTRPSPAAPREGRPAIREDRPSRSVAAPARPRRREREPEPSSGLANVPLWVWGIVGGGVFLLLLAFGLLLALLVRPSGPTPSRQAGGPAPPATTPQAGSKASPRERLQSLREKREANRDRTQTPRAAAPYPKPAVKDPEDRKVYLSDLEEQDVGEFGQRWSFGKNGELRGSPGQPLRIKINGVISDKGLSMHPPAGDYAFVRYRIAPAEVFQAFVGLADSADEKLRGDAYFEVHGNGQRLWRSEPVSQRGQFQDCRVSLQGIRSLELRVYPPDGTFGNHGCQAIWIDPYLVRARDSKSAEPVTVLPWDGDELYLADVKETDVRGLANGWKLGKHSRVGDGKNRIKVDGKPVQHGLGTHPEKDTGARITYNLAGEASSLQTEVAINDSSFHAFSPVVFEVAGDGRTLWKSKPISKGGSDRCNVSLKGVRELELRVYCQGGITNTGCHAVWIDPVLKRAVTKK